MILNSSPRISDSEHTAKFDVTFQTSKNMVLCNQFQANKNISNDCSIFLSTYVYNP